MTVTNSIPSTLLSTTNQLRAIKPPVRIPTGWEWLWWAAAAIVAAGLLYALWRWWRARKARLPVVPLDPAHVRARQRLDDALRYISDPREFCIRVSDALRLYLEEQFDFRAPERTTEEFLRELQATPLLTEQQKLTLADFLQRCDLVKFAKHEPPENELRDLHGGAVRLVSETEPLVQSAPGARANGPSPQPA